MSGAGTADDVLDGPWDDTAHWSTANLGEAAPGVLTPLGWAFWGKATNQAVPGAFAAFGALDPAEAVLPEDRANWVIALFHGRTAINVDFLCSMGDRLPGTSGAAVAQQVLGYVPDALRRPPDHRRLPAIAAKFPRVFATLPSRLKAEHTRTDAWWRREIGRAPSLTLLEARAQWRDAVEWFTRTATLQVVSLFAGVQPVYDQLHALAARAGCIDQLQTLLAGLGSHAETEMVEDLWRMSRGNGTPDEFLARHGYHGPNAGDLPSRVWREDPAPVLRLLEQYQRRPDSDSPSAMLRLRAEERITATRALLSGLGPLDRVRARAVLRLAATYIPLRGVGKVSYVQSIDVGRAAARRIGVLLAELGVIAAGDDVFYLTEPELLDSGPGDDLTSAVATRRARRKEYLGLELPSSWHGRPTPVIAPDLDRKVGMELNGVGASSGVAEGRARVVLDPADADLEPGEILVAPTTDPSWSAVMFSSAGLVVDLGGALSHAAVVARELGVPCVMGTGNGTKLLRTGDLCRVDGRSGQVRLLELARPSSLPAAN